jgi:hypothetical protein
VVAKEAKEVEEVVNLMEAVEGHQVEGEAHPGQSMPALNLDLD